MNPDQYDDLRGAHSIDAFCKAWGIGRTRVYELINSGELRAVKCGTRTLILRHDAETWARSLPAIKLSGASP